MFTVTGVLGNINFTNSLFKGNHLSNHSLVHISFTAENHENTMIFSENNSVQFFLGGV